MRPLVCVHPKGQWPQRAGGSKAASWHPSNGAPLGSGESGCSSHLHLVHGGSRDFKASPHSRQRQISLRPLVTATAAADLPSSARNGAVTAAAPPGHQVALSLLATSSGALRQGRRRRRIRLHCIVSTLNHISVLVSFPLSLNHMI